MQRYTPAITVNGDHVEEKLLKHETWKFAEHQNCNTLFQDVKQCDYLTKEKEKDEKWNEKKERKREGKEGKQRER